MVDQEASQSAEDQSKDLTEIIGDDAFNHPDCFNSSRYSDWEEKIAKPLIEAKGFTVISWWSTDSDAFGPLVRCVLVEKDGKQEKYFYG